MTPSSGAPLRKTARRRNPEGGIHFITFSCYQRLPLLGNARVRAEFAAGLGRVRERHRFKLIAWVVNDL